MIALPTLERLARLARQARAGARCDLCGAAIAEERHRHAVDRDVRRLLCACSPCVLGLEGAAGRFATVPEAVRAVDAGGLTADDLDALRVPVGLAFFFKSSRSKRWTAVFPSVLGPAEAELGVEGLDLLEARTALVASIADDVEAILVRRDRRGRCVTFVVPVDVCYELVAVLRAHWRGIDGGDDARRRIDALFDSLSVRAGGRA